MWIYRIKYGKKGAVRFISHLDTMRAIKRALQRAQTPVAYSQGFNPRPKLSMGPALQLGCESECEFADIVLTRSIPPQELREDLERAMPEGLYLLDVDRVLPTMPRLSRASSVRYMIELPCDLALDEAESLVQAFREKDSALIERIRKGKRSEIDVRALVLDIAVTGEADARRLSVGISVSERGTCGPVEVARAVFGISPESAKCLKAVRSDMKFEEGKA